jgi:NAD(P)-dependent dehydrogenase (short-subunit alcohol dehydrogenase family)
MKTWFITGTSKGFGRLWAEAALRRGDTVVATARNIATLASLEKEFGDRAICLELDVNNKQAVDAAVETAHKRMGSIDVVVNNAGYGLFGMIEELTEAEARAQMETNFFGALWVTKAVLPIMRAQKRGHILQVSSIGGVNAFSGIGLYNASKWALEGFSQALAAEVKDFGIHVTIIEPTGYPTDWAGASSVQSKQMPEYNPPREWMARLRKSRPAAKVEATSAVVLKLVDMKEPPLRIFFGDGPLDMIKAEYKSRIETWDRFAALTHEANG